MPSETFPRLRRLCTALPKSQLDEQFASLSTIQKLIVLTVTALVVLTVPPLLVTDAAAPTVGVALGFGTLSALTALLAKHTQQ